MHERLSFIKERYFTKESLTCVVATADGDVYPSRQRGVLPLLRLVNSGLDFTGGFAADKVVGRGAAVLYVLLHVGELWADVISRPALELLEQHGIACEYGTLADEIVNRTGDGRCPMEEAVLGIDDMDEALAAIKCRQRELLGDNAHLVDDLASKPMFTEWTKRPPMPRPMRRRPVAVQKQQGDESVPN